jgi:hypothetical protein
MERRFRVRLGELLNDAEVPESLLRGVMPRLQTFLEPFLASLKIAEQRINADQYVSGLLSDLRSKDVESISYLHDRERQGLQKFIGQSAWDHRPLMKELARQVGTELGEADGVLVFDPSSFVKKGNDSVGGTAMVRPARQGRELSGRHLPELRFASRTRAGRFPALPAQEVGQPKAKAEEGGSAGGGSLPNAARTDPGDAVREWSAAAARVDRRRRRTGSFFDVSSGIASEKRALLAGRAEQHLDARHGGARTAVQRSGPSSECSVPACGSVMRRVAGRRVGND